MIRKYGKSRTIALTVMGALLVLASSGSVTPSELAQASTTADLYSCNSLNQAVETEDGSLVLLGETTSCGANGVAPFRRQVLLGLTPDGKIRPGFGDGGVVLGSLGDQEMDPKLIETTGGNLLVQTSHRVRAYDRNGKVLTSFGTHGQVTPISLDQINTTPMDIAATADGGFLVAGSHQQKIRVGRYDADGQLITTFGTDGAVDTSLPGAAALTVDQAGRILVANESSLIRLDANGSPDGSFGVSGSTDLHGFPVYGISLGDQGKITVVSGGTTGFYGWPAYARYLDGNGVVLSPSPPESIGWNIQYAVTYPGGIAYSTRPGKYADSRFTIGTSGESPARSRFLSPGYAMANGLTPLADGSILAVGESGDADCGSYCDSRDRMAVIKLDPATGDPVKAFGSAGTRLIPGNGCRFGSGGKVGDWNLCRVEKPVLTGSAKVSGTFKRHPSIRIKSSLGDPPRDLWGTRQVLTLKLPAGVQPRKSKRQLVEVNTVPDRSATVKVSGRKITVRVNSQYEIWGGNFGEVGDENDVPLKIEVRIRKGALQPIARKKRRKMGPITARGTFVPALGGMQGAPVRTWFAPRSANAKIRIGR